MAGIEDPVTARVAGVEVPQELEAVTEILPLVADAVTVIEFVVLDPVHPEGNAQVYDVALATALTAYTCDVPEQTVAKPLMMPG